MTEVGHICIINNVSTCQGDNARRGACVICKKTLDKVFIWRSSDHLEDKWKWTVNVKSELSEHNVGMQTGFRWHRTGLSGGIFHRDMTILDNKNHSSVRKFHLTSGSAVNTAVLICRESGSMHLLPSVALNPLALELDI